MLWRLEENTANLHLRLFSQHRRDLGHFHKTHLLLSWLWVRALSQLLRFRENTTVLGVWLKLIHLTNWLTEDSTNPPKKAELAVIQTAGREGGREWGEERRNWAMKYSDIHFRIFFLLSQCREKPDGTAKSLWMIRKYELCEIRRLRNNTIVLFWCQPFGLKCSGKRALHVQWVHSCAGGEQPGETCYSSQGRTLLTVSEADFSNVTF